MTREPTDFERFDSQFERTADEHEEVNRRYRQRAQEALRILDYQLVPETTEKLKEKP